MSDNTLVWWTGVVEDRDDPEKLGRCRVRIFGFHTEDTNLLPTSDLPWAIPLQSITSAATSGVGSTPVGIVPGTWVMGWFLDGDEAQRPLIIGTLAGKPAKEVEAEKKQKQDSVPNNVLKSERGEPLYDQQGNYITTANTAVDERDTLTPLKSNDLTKLFDSISTKVSGNNYSKIGTNGELGKYQIDVTTLIDLGYIKRPLGGVVSANLIYDETNWSGKDGIISSNSFLSNQSVQESAMFTATQRNYNTLLRMGKVTTNDEYAVVGGLLATSHVMGVKNSDKLDKKDSAGTRAKEYFVIGNSALGGNATQYIKTFEETGNFLPSTSAENTVDQNNEDLKKQVGFKDPNKKYPKYEYLGLPDVNKLALGDTTHTAFKIKENKRIEKIQIARTSQTWDEPASAYGAGYPYNQVIETEAGHVIELDSTPNAERIHIFHKSGSYIEVDVNGTSVRKVVGDNYEVLDRNNFVYVKGAQVLTVEGKTSILVKDNASIEVEGDLTVTGHRDTLVQTAGAAGIVASTAIVSAKNGIDMVSEGTINIQGKDINMYAKGGTMTQKAGKDILLQSGSSNKVSIKGGLQLLLDAAIVKTKMGADTIAAIARGILTPPDKKTPDTTEIPVLPREITAKSNYLFDSGEDGSEDYKKSQVDKGIISDSVTPQISPNDSAATRSLSTGNPNKVVQCDCVELREFKYFPRSFILSSNGGRVFTLGDMLQDGALVAQRGLTEHDIVCNLKQLAVNCLDPIKAKYPDMKINSGFRPGTNGSDHGLGAAVDIKFTNTSKTKYKEIAEWIVANIPHRQVLLEYYFEPGGKLRSAWIHLAFLTKDGSLVKFNKPPVMTFMNHAAVYNKLVNLA